MNPTGDIYVQSTSRNYWKIQSNKERMYEKTERKETRKCVLLSKNVV
jgi:hypothetical protein